FETYLVPDRKNDLFAADDLARGQPVELDARPTLPEECRTEDDQPEAAPNQPAVDLLPKAVAEPDLSFVDPHPPAAFSEQRGKWSNNCLLVFARMADEEVVIGVGHALDSAARR